MSRPLARRFDADLTAVDDIQAALERMTSPEQYPELHRWRLHPRDVVALDDEGMLAHTLANAAVVCEALEPIIAEHLESSVPVVLDGDFLLPSLAAKATFDDVPADGRVQALFLYDDERRLLENFRLREARSRRDVPGRPGGTASTSVPNASGSGFPASQRRRGRRSWIERSG